MNVYCLMKSVSERENSLLEIFHYESDAMKAKQSREKVFSDEKLTIEKWRVS